MDNFLHKHEFGGNDNVKASDTTEFNKNKFYVYDCYNGGLTNMNYNEKKNYIRIHPGPTNQAKYQVSVKLVQPKKAKNKDTMENVCNNDTCTKDKVWECIETVCNWWHTKSNHATLQTRSSARTNYNSNKNIKKNTTVVVNGGPIPHVLIALLFAYRFMKLKQKVEITMEHYGAKNYEQFHIKNPNEMIEKKIADEAYNHLYKHYCTTGVFHIFDLVSFFKKEFPKSICHLWVGIGSSIKKQDTSGKNNPVYCVVESKSLPWDKNFFYENPFVDDDDDDDDDDEYDEYDDDDSAFGTTKKTMKTCVVLKEQKNCQIFPLHGGLLPSKTFPVTFKTKTDLWDEITGLKRSSHRMVITKIQQYNIDCRHVKLDKEGNVNFDPKTGILDLYQHKVQL